MPLPSTSLCPVWLASREALHKWAAAHVASLAVRSLSSVSRGSTHTGSYSLCALRSVSQSLSTKKAGFRPPVRYTQNVAIRKNPTKAMRSVVAVGIRYSPNASWSDSSR
jgi:hypothetical protein